MKFIRIAFGILIIAWGFGNYLVDMKLSWPQNANSLTWTVVAVSSGAQILIHRQRLKSMCRVVLSYSALTLLFVLSSALLGISYPKLAYRMLVGSQWLFPQYRLYLVLLGGGLFHTIVIAFCVWCLRTKDLKAI